MDKNSDTAKYPENNNDVDTDIDTDNSLVFVPTLNVQRGQNDEFVPFPIYKRPKHDDDEDRKQTSLSPQQYSSAKAHALPKGDVPDLKLFQNMEIVECCRSWNAAKGLLAAKGTTMRLRVRNNHLFCVPL